MSPTFDEYDSLAFASIGHVLNHSSSINIISSDVLRITFHLTPGSGSRFIFWTFDSEGMSFI